MARGGQELAGDEIELGYDSTGLADEDLIDGELINYTGNSADILAAKELAKAAPPAATVEAARPVEAGRASAVSRDAIAAADIVRVQELTQGEPTGANGNGKINGGDATSAEEAAPAGETAIYSAAPTKGKALTRTDLALARSHSIAAEAQQLGCEPGDLPDIASYPSTLLSDKSWADQGERKLYNGRQQIARMPRWRRQPKRRQLQRT